MANIGYRTDIDGLRAIAVLAVIIFHIHESSLSGGFVGVDVFFVISGYLISAQIFKEIELGSFSLTEFYRRRIKRIFPAMLVVVAVVIVSAQIVLLPSDAELVAESGLWSIASAANVYFWWFEDNSYFAAANEVKPLLHLWSLGVEEQFYLFWPLLLMLIYRRLKIVIFVALLVALSLISFALGEGLFDQAPTFSYYMLPSRIGEFIIGALVALALRKGVKLGRKSSNVLATVGLLSLAYTLVFYSEETTFPGYRAMIPTLATALLLWSGASTNNTITRLLGFSVLRWVGKVSYSAYLWHWPLLAFYRYGNFEVDLISGAALFVTTFFLAWLSYLWVEVPARQAKLEFPAMVWRFVALPVCGIGVIALVSMKIDGVGVRDLSGDYSIELAAVRQTVKPAYHFDYVCQRQKIQRKDLNNPSCIVGNRSTSGPSILLLGDSNAAHYVGVLGAFAAAQGFQFSNLEIGSCPLLLNRIEVFTSQRRAQDCQDWSDLIEETIENYDVLVISVNWEGYSSHSKEFLAEFSATLRELIASRKQIVLIGKAPVFEGFDRHCQAKELSFPLLICESFTGPLSRRIREINGKLRTLANSLPSVEYIDFNDVLCPNQLCSTHSKRGDPLYYDSNHLSLPASWDIGRQIIRDSGVPFPFNRLSDSKWQYGESSSASAH